MRMNFAMAGVDHQPFKIRLVNQLFQQRFPDALVSPPTKATVRVFPIPIIRGQVPPGRSRAQHPENRVDVDEYGNVHINVIV